MEASIESSNAEVFCSETGGGGGGGGGGGHALLLQIRAVRFASSRPEFMNVFFHHSSLSTSEAL